MGLVEVVGITIMFVAVLFTFFQRDKLYDTKRGCYYISDVDKEFKYKLELTGRLPNDDFEKKLVVYADDENLTFEDVMWIVFSEQTDGVDSIYVEVKK